MVAKFGVDNGIVFLPGLKDFVKGIERKSSEKVANQKQTKVLCCPCSDSVEQANADIGAAVAGLSVYCLSLSGFPPAAGFCWAGVAALYFAENDRINSTEFWFACMQSHYGICVY